MFVALFFVFLVGVPFSVLGHGMVMDPVNRASRWRVDEDAPVDFDDNGLFCGGKSVQWEQNGGKCGLCGDNYADATPRAHELGGPYGQGTIVKTYEPGSEMLVQVLITANHKGFFNFSICNMDVFGEEKEECFDIPLLTTDGKDKYYIEYYNGYHNVSLKIPDKLQCEHCIFQWTYTAGNTWGECEEGHGGVGCGEQETFRTCSDISIIP